METEYPSLSTRLQSIFIDMIFLIAFMIAISSLLDHFPSAPGWIRAVAFIAIFAIYEPACLAFGCTVGNYIKGIRVKKFTDTGSRINILQAFIRYVVKLSLGWISFLTIHSNPERRAIHDMASGSVMVYYK
ncbi:RDD family protein [Mucilaginibacter sp. L3T2-6]|jgi:uncharacterized RDD family membrane protein YckC|uniref:RDD family protein n=1 Tax=Mucilaginibacter sp. L3T2-6 TaxID=3062491 RepID=UPI0026755404|nr:RDD family protein [Mucilaginibacter sp. L3T2-6]MDO3640974.1 RDD family protein [Mucilaginibacter sp. L3T2-6]MDV6213550.1 RDD family protein [Mucilaginibacter sp. L3T2-6]